MHRTDVGLICASAAIIVMLDLTPTPLQRRGVIVRMCWLLICKWPWLNALHRCGINLRICGNYSNADIDLTPNPSPKERGYSQNVYVRDSKYY